MEPLIGICPFLFASNLRVVGRQHGGIINTSMSRPVVDVGQEIKAWDGATPDGRRWLLFDYHGQGARLLTAPLVT
jgi:hypothetical protein